MAKSGLMMLTTCYADRLAAEGIMVHELRPGVVDTDMTKVVHEKYTRLIAEGQFPIARWGTPEDWARSRVWYAMTILFTPPATTLMWTADSISRRL